VLVAELNRVSRLVLVFGQVPNLEVFVLVNCKELANPGCEPGLLVTEVLHPFKNCFFGGCVFAVFDWHDFRVFEVQETPFYLCNREISLVVPDGNGGRKFFLKERYRATGIGSQQKTLV